MPFWDVHCRHEECSGCRYEQKGAPKGICDRSGCDIDPRYVVEDKDGDTSLTYSQSNRIGVSWAKGLREQLTAHQTDKQGLKCAICYKVIKTDGQGRIAYTSKSGKIHIERPPIDHFNPDWADRLRSLEKMPAYINANLPAKKTLLQKLYNSPGLRITHRGCNLTKKPGS